MKLSIFLSALLLGHALAQDTGTPAKAEEKQKKQYQIDIANLPDEQREQYFGFQIRAEQLFGQKRIFECLEKLRAAHEIYDRSPGTLNLVGACYVEFRDFKKAQDSFQRAKTADPDNKNVAFNMAEISFVTHKWAESLTRFEEIKELYAGGFTQNMGDLIDFKIILCQLKTGKVDEATASITKLTYKDDTPLFYFGNASLAYQADNTAEAEAWLARARRVFRNPQALASWQDTLIEFGYIKSFYGGDLEIEEAE